MAKIGYARVSSKEQHLDRQLAALKDVDKLFTDKLSGAKNVFGYFDIRFDFS
ncbi:Site-specific recombinase DNA invertase Pinrelated protein [Lactiplantibacillus plantarum]|nr:Site-specific recombinase DNA invertase Pinrelated protein [Lactiplantibacillus plantarum]